MSPNEINKVLDDMCLPHKLYFCVLERDDEMLCKVGITKYDIKTRFSTEKNYQPVMTLGTLEIVFKTGHDARGFESTLLERLLPFKDRYTPKKSLSGRGECYKMDAYGNTIRIIRTAMEHPSFKENGGIGEVFEGKDIQLELELKDILNNALVIEPEVKTGKINSIELLKAAKKREANLTEKSEVTYLEIEPADEVVEDKEEVIKRIDKSFMRKLKDTNTIVWYDGEGNIHNSHGPAVTKQAGTQEWFIHGNRHREDGPAIMRSNGAEEYWVDGVKHREDGPAVTRANGNMYWWTKGKMIKKEIISQLAD